MKQLTFFDNLKNIIYNKDRSLLEGELDYKNFSLYMINKWISFYSNEMCGIINKLSNTSNKVFDDNKYWYKFLFGVIPTLRYRRINYVRRNIDKPNKVSIEVLSFLANQMELSQREVSEYVKFFDIDVNKIGKLIKEK